MTGDVIRHANLVARYREGAWRGVLIEGASGAGKSDLALRLIAEGWRLVADDRVLVWRSGAAVFGRAPNTLTGLLEIRGLGVVSQPIRPFVEIVLLGRCVDAGDIERLPETASEPLLGCDLPVTRLAAHEASATVKLTWALTCIGLKRQRAYQAVRASRR